MEDAKLAKSVVSAYKRSSADRAQVAIAVGDKAVREKLKLVVKPPRLSSSLKKAGVVLVLAPDPLTLVPGSIMIGLGHVARGRDPANLGDMVAETRKMMSELQSLL